MKFCTVEMSDLEVLKEKILDKNVFKTSIKDSNYNIITLEENTKGHNYKLTIKKVPKNTIAIKADKFLPAIDDKKNTTKQGKQKPKEEFFTCNNGICRRADYILVNDMSCIFIELYKPQKTKGDKTTRRGVKKEAEDQLNGAKCLMDYIVSIGQIFFKKDSYLEDPLKDSCSILLIIDTPKKRAKNPTNNNNSYKLIYNNKNELYYDKLIKG